MNENKKKYAELSHTVMAEMISDGYSAKSVEHHNKYVFDSITEFRSEKYEGYYSVGAGKVFLESVYQRHLSKPQEKVYLHTVERLNHALEGDTHWHPDNHQYKDYISSSYDPIVRDYENYLYQTGKTTTNVRHHIHSISRFLCHMDSLGIYWLSDITSEHIYERFIDSNDKAGFHKTLKMFFRYAYKYGLTGKELTHCIPSVTRHIPVPTVYSSDEINKILNVIDRNSWTGKRDYCIVLMASKLGIRSCDIAALQLNDIHEKEGILHIKQQKTNIPID